MSNVWLPSLPFSFGQTNDSTSPLCLKPRSSAVEMLQKMQIERCWVKVVATCNKESFQHPKIVQSCRSWNGLLQDSERIHTCSGNLKSLDTMALGRLVFESTSLYRHFGIFWVGPGMIRCDSEHDKMHLKCWGRAREAVENKIAGYFAATWASKRALRRFWNWLNFLQIQS